MKLISILENHGTGITYFFFFIAKDTYCTYKMVPGKNSKWYENLSKEDKKEFIQTLVKKNYTLYEVS